MADREKVIKGLECCRDLDMTDMRCPDACPYHDDSNEFGCCHYTPLMNDAIALLKAQEPVTEEVYGRGYDTAGNYHWYGVYTGHHIMSKENKDGT